MTTPIEPNPPRWSPSTDPTSIIVPGLDTNAPINDQVDQIEQLITIKLQNTDANFSRIQHLMATRFLPAVKRYALGTEPVREAAKFWTSFYEQAAQVHIPTLDDDDLMHDEHTQPSVVTSESASVSQREDLDVSHSRTPSEITYDVTASESSFMPANAVSSTPARPGHAPDQTADDHPSWSASLELPMVRLKSELQSFAREEEEEVSARQDTSSLTDSLMDEEDNTIQQFPSFTREKTEKNADRDEPRARVQPSHIPQSVLPTPRANVTTAYVSPLKVKPKTFSNLKANGQKEVLKGLHTRNHCSSSSSVTALTTDEMRPILQIAMHDEVRTTTPTSMPPFLRRVCHARGDPVSTVSIVVNSLRETTCVGLGPPERACSFRLNATSTNPSSSDGSAVAFTTTTP
ncbi:DASH complex subunit Ask1-domain-containing protein [Boletus coccyginus]|nr:DASH complex subunit Ask1-domain-containing protein [Boletus coccyginus]